MLERNELARAMTELPDELLLEQEWTARPTRIVKFRRIIAAAAVIALLTVTVGAVSAGITWQQSKKTAEDLIQRFGAIHEDYYETPNGILDFEKLEFTVPLEVKELPEQNMETIRNLTRRWENKAQGEDMDFYVQNYMGHYSIPEKPFITLWTLADVEAFLGITLDLPDTLRTAIEQECARYDGLVWVRIYAGTAEAEGNLEPAKVEISFQVAEYATNGQANVTIAVALSEEAAREGMLVETYSYEKEGAFWQEEQTVGGYAVNLYGNDPEEGFNGSAGAIYTSGGIGYHISASRDADIPYYSPGWPYYDSAREMLLSLFADVE